MTIARVPGKVLLAGEYAVLLPDQPCLVAAVDRYVTVETKPSRGWSVDTGQVIWKEGEPVPPAVQFVAAAADAMHRTFDVLPHLIETSDELHFDGLKLGLGGSAAATVGAVLAQMVAAVGSPAWEFPEYSMFLWITLALGMALAGVAERGRERARQPRYEEELEGVAAPVEVGG